MNISGLILAAVFSIVLGVYFWLKRLSVDWNLNFDQHRWWVTPFSTTFKFKDLFYRLPFSHKVDESFEYSCPRTNFSAVIF